MAVHIASSEDGDKLFYDRRNEQGYARGHILTADGNRIDVPNIASLVYRGYGWKLNRAGRKTPLMPE